jgi:hypothetical protein
LPEHIESFCATDDSGEDGKDGEEGTSSHEVDESCLSGLRTEEAYVPLPFDLEEYRKNRIGNGVMRHVEFKPVTTNEYGTTAIPFMGGALSVPFHMVMMGLHLFFPPNLYEADRIRNIRMGVDLDTVKTDGSICVSRAYASWNKREVSWTGDNWCIEGWGPPLCKHCTYAPFVNKQPDMHRARQWSAYAPTFAPFSFVDLEERHTRCAFVLDSLTSPSYWDASKPSHSNLLIGLIVARPNDYTVGAECEEDNVDTIHGMVTFLEKNRHREYGPSNKNRSYSTNGVR